MTVVAVFLTAKDARESRRLATALVQERLAACVNELGPVRSVYRWKGRVERAQEHLLMAKSDRRRVPALVQRVKELHSYDVPEVIALPILAGNPDYLSWVATSSRP